MYLCLKTLSLLVGRNRGTNWGIALLSDQKRHFWEEAQVYDCCYGCIRSQLTIWLYRNASKHRPNVISEKLIAFVSLIRWPLYISNITWSAVSHQTASAHYDVDVSDMFVRLWLWLRLLCMIRFPVRVCICDIYVSLTLFFLFFHYQLNLQYLIDSNYFHLMFVILM